VVVLTASCSTSDDGRPVAVVGDSITILATPALEQAFGHSYQAQVDAINGKRIDQMLPALRAAVAAGPFAVVENLGSNDSIEGGAHSDWQRSWDKLVKATAHVSCVVLTTVNVATQFYGGRAIASGINDRIVALAAQDPKRYKVADWNGFLAQRQAERRKFLLQDLVHETPLGAHEIATLTRHALDECHG
jgi:hypothetical protein